MTLLTFAPVAYVLVGDGKLVLALLGWLGIQAVEPLPDQDFHLPVLNHRGVSHSLVAVFVIGCILGATGWLLGDHLFEWLYALFSMGGNLWGWLLDRLPDLSASILAGMMPNVSPEEISATIQQQAGGSVDRRAFATFGFFVGVYGVLAHLLGDVITDMGIKPFLPFSRWGISLSPLRADNPRANSALFGLGVLAIVVVLVATVPGIGAAAAATPADLSPVGIGAVQTANQTGNQSANQTQNATVTDSPSANRTANQSAKQGQTQSRAAVIFRNQTTNGSVVTIERVTLPDNGFIGVHTGGYATGPAPAEYSIIAVSRNLPAGTHRNVTIDISHAPPTNAPGLNLTQLNTSQTLAVVVYRDSDDDHRFDFVSSFGENDTAFTENGSVVSDSARVRVPSPPPQTASLVFENQTLRDDTLTVEQVQLPRGGFVVAHNASYRRTGDALSSVVGTSRYLPPGNYTNITIRVAPNALDETQVVTVQPSLDTNDNRRYDFIRSSGFQDVAYENRTGERVRIVTDSALVRVPGSDRTAHTQSSSSPSTQTATTGPATGTPSTGTTRGESGSGGLFDSIGLPAIAGIIVVLVVLPTLIRKFR